MKSADNVEVIHSETIKLDTIDRPSDESSVKIQLGASEPDEKELDFEYPKVIRKWWSMDNVVKLSCWTSFWISFYIFIDSVRVVGSRVSEHFEFVVRNQSIPNSEEYGNPGFPILVASIFFFALLLNGIILVVDSKLNIEGSFETVKTSPKSTLKNYFCSTLMLASWALTEMFLVAIGLIYFYYLYGSLKLTHYLLCLRFLLVFVALTRLWQVIKYEQLLAQSISTGVNHE